MLARTTAYLLLIFFLLPLPAGAQDKQPDWVRKTGARVFPASTRLFRVKAKPDTTIAATGAIQAALDLCAAKGGGIVVFDPGTYVTGALFIRSGVQLRIDKAVTLLGSQRFEDYPLMDTRIAGIEMKWPAALINFIDVKNAALTGEGTINARGKFCWDKYWEMRRDYDARGLRWVVDYDAQRVRTVLVQRSVDITLRGVRLKNAGFWTVQLLYSSHLTVGGLIIRNNEDGHGPSTDGVDVDSSSWVLIRDCDIDCNDDNFCLKAGRDRDGLRVNRPTEYVVIRNCLARRGAGLVTLGSETSGGIRHIFATDLKASHTDNGLRLKSATTRGGVIEDIYFQNSDLDSVKNVFQYNLNWYPAYSYSTLPAGYTESTIPPHWKTLLQKVTPEEGTPFARGFYIRGIRASHAGNVFEAAGLPGSWLTRFVYTDCRISAASPGTLEFTRDWQFNRCNFSVERPPEVKTKQNQAELERQQ